MILHLSICDETDDLDPRGDAHEHVCERCGYRTAFGLCTDCEWWLAEIAYAERRRGE